MSDTLSQAARQQLQTLAEAAEAKGTWYADNSSASGFETELWSEGPASNDDYYIGDLHGAFNSAFIVAAQPQTFLALLSALAAQEAENERLRQAMTALEKRWRAEMLTNKQFANRQTNYWQKQLADAQAQTSRHCADELAALRQSLSASTPEQET